jgi:peptide-methionine (S)-S-oxide reductase
MIFRIVALAAALAAPAFAAERMTMVPAPSTAEAVTAKSETIVLAGGCFWGVQGVFQHVNGVMRAESGYAGGAAETARYHEVGSGDTGHAESVEVTFDPSVVSLGTILQIYFSVAHDPTQLNRQGPDRGTQYRSAIFTTTPEQAAYAKAYIAEIDAAGVLSDKIVTTVDPLPAFYAAEAYHQDYATLHPTDGYIAYNDLPKIEGVRTMFPQVWRDQPVLIGAGG